MENTVFHCFVCTKDVDLQTSVDFCQDISLHSFVMIRILDLPVDYTDLSDKVQSILFCSSCYLKLQKTRLALENLEELEEQVLQHKFEIETSLKNIQHAQDLEGNTEPSLKFRKEISDELKKRTVISMVSKLKRKNLGDCKTLNTSIRVMKNVEISQQSVRQNESSRRKKSGLSASINPLESPRPNPYFELPTKYATVSQNPRVESASASGTSSVDPIQVYVDPSEPAFDLVEETNPLADSGLAQELFPEEIQEFKIEVLEYSKDRNQSIFCATCGLVFENYDELQGHEQLHFPPIKIDIQENDKVCDKDLTQPSLQASTNSHQTPRPGPSQSKHWSTKQYRLSKVNVTKKTGQRKPRRQFNSSDVKLHQCKVCGKKFSDVSTLTRHIFGVHGEKNFICGACKLRFGVLTYLKRHLKRTSCGKHPANINVLYPD